jgi:preprotein translocase subunit YajC
VLELLPLVGIVLLFWLFIIRPASRRQREVRSMQSALSVGDEIVLTSGVYGTVRALADDLVHLEIADGVTIRVARGAVGSVSSPDGESQERADATDEQEPGELADGSEES